MACILDYAKQQGAPITAKNMHTWADFREAANVNDQAGEAIKKAYQQLAALMASYNIHMQQAVNEAEQGICLKPERNFGRGQRNVFAGPLIWRELADKYDGVNQAARDDLATKLTRAVAIDISAMRAANVDNWLLTIHSCILALRQRKTSEEVIESAATAPVLEALQSMQDRQDGMCQAEWRTIGKKAAHYYELRRSVLSSDNRKCTWDVVYAQLSKTCVAARTKALNDASKAPTRGRQAPHMPVAMAFVSQAEHQIAFGAFTQKQYEQLSLEEYEIAMMAAYTAPAATVEEFKAHINTGRPLPGGPGLLFKGQ